MMNQTELIKVENVSVEFQTGDEVIKPLRDVSFSIMPNSFNIIYGASGSGKSTLLNVLTGLQKPSSGTVMINGSDVYSLASDELARFRANDIGFIYQTNYWIKSLNVIDNVSMPLFFMGHLRHQAEELADRALESVNMINYKKKYPILLSGGEQQRIAVARALSSEPEFIIADEPTGSLDSKNGDFIMDLLQECRTKLGRTIILVTHNMEYLPLADKLLHIADGQVQEMPTSKIKETTDLLLQQMKERIDRLSESRGR